MIETPCLFQTHCFRDNKLIRAPKGTTIVMPEQRASYIYHLHEGIVGFVSTSPDGREAVNVLMVPPMLLGVAGFAGMDSDRNVDHIAEARAMTPVVYCRTKREAVWDLMDDREARAQVMDMIFHTVLLLSRITGPPIASDVQPRIIAILDVLGRSVGVPDEDDKIVIKGIAHDDIATMARITRPTASRALEKLEDRGLISLERRRIVLLQPEKMAANPWA